MSPHPTIPTFLISAMARHPSRTRAYSAVMSIVETEDRGAVRHVVLNRPEKRNAFNDELILGLREALQAAATDDAVQCVVLRGSGPMFSSGMDQGSLGALAGRADQLRKFRTPIIET